MVQAEGGDGERPQGLPAQLPDLPVEWLAPASHWLMLDRPEQTSWLLGQLVVAGAGAAGARSASPAGARA